MDPKDSLIANRRRQKQLSQVELAQRAGVSQATVSRLEKGEGPTSLHVLAKIARALGIPVREIADEAIQDLLQQGMPESFFAICPNPFCKKNELSRIDGRPAVSWQSGQFYPIERREDVNFCSSCGTELAKECPSCGKLIEERATRYCIRCGQEIHERPTPEEWARIAEQLPADDDIPF